MSQVYTGTMRVRHDELDCFGRVQPAVYLRYLAQVAVDASTAAGFDPAWYAAAGTTWIVRRSTVDVLRPVTDGAPLAVRTWVEEFRRVRSLRRYEIHAGDAERCLDAVTDWVYVDAATGRPRRAPAEMEARLGVLPGATSGLRAPWSAPAPPATSGRASARVRFADVDTVGHMNNAAYVDVAEQALLDVLAARGWPLARLRTAGAVPLLAHVDLEYLGSAVYGDEIETLTWFSSGALLVAHQYIGRRGDPRPLARATTRWHWVDPITVQTAAAPAELAAALAELTVA
ncbi:MAG: thioesterase [Candidatus Binatia bacterium]